MLHDRLPWFWLAVVIQTGIFAAIGLLATFALWAMLPHGHPQPDATTVLVRFALRYIGMPIAFTLTLAGVAALLLKYRYTKVAAMTLLAPLALSPWLLSGVLN